MTRFLLDVMCGKLAVYLRMCSHDAAYALDRDVEADDRLLALASEEGRRLVTRDRDLAGEAEDALLLTETDVRDQLRECRVAGVTLTLDDRPARCGRCNGRVEPVDGNSPEYAPDPEAVDQWRCADCGQVFWKGSHWDGVAATLAGL